MISKVANGDDVGVHCAVSGCSFSLGVLTVCVVMIVIVKTGSVKIQYCQHFWHENVSVL